MFGDSNNPNRNLNDVREALKTIYSGRNIVKSNKRFYIVCIAPNVGREAVVYYSEIELYSFVNNILCHFDDMKIDCKESTKPYCGLYDILKTVSLNGDIEKKCPPNLPDAIVKSIFEGLPYPYTLFSSCIRRIRAEQEVRIARIAILKAYLNRLKDNNKKIQQMLDKENTNHGYLCGRLFAVLDKIQEDAYHINSIRERYMNAASATPSSVFATILNLSSHHSEKLNEGSKVFYEKLKQEIIDKLSADGFPTHLSLQDQGRFFIGFYHQRQSFFITKKNDNTTDNN